MDLGFSEEKMVEESESTVTAAGGESLLDKISEKHHGHDSSSDSDFDSVKPMISSVKDMVFAFSGGRSPLIPSSTAESV